MVERGAPVTKEKPPQLPRLQLGDAPLDKQFKTEESFLCDPVSDQLLTGHRIVTERNAGGTQANFLNDLRLNPTGAEENPDENELAKIQTYYEKDGYQVCLGRPEVGALPAAPRSRPAFLITKNKKLENYCSGNELPVIVPLGQPIRKNYAMTLLEMGPLSLGDYCVDPAKSDPQKVALKLNTAVWDRQARIISEMTGLPSDKITKDTDFAQVDLGNHSPFFVSADIPMIAGPMTLLIKDHLRQEFQFQWGRDAEERNWQRQKQMFWWGTLAGGGPSLILGIIGTLIQKRSLILAREQIGMAKTQMGMMKEQLDMAKEQMGMMREQLDLSKAQMDLMKKQMNELEDADRTLTVEEAKEVLLRYSEGDLLKRAADGALPPFIDTKNELNRIYQALASDQNVALLGPGGVGKSARAEGLATAIARGKIQGWNLDNTIMVEINLNNLLAGTRYRGDYEKKIKLILRAHVTLKDNGINSLLFIDEMAQEGRGDSKDGPRFWQAAKQTLGRKGGVIAATTHEEYKAEIASDSAVARRFAGIDIVANTSEETKKILIDPETKQYLSKRYGEGRVTYTDDAVREVIKIASLYLPEETFPAKGVKVFQTIVGKARLDHPTGDFSITETTVRDLFFGSKGWTPDDAALDLRVKDRIRELKEEVRKRTEVESVVTFLRSAHVPEDQWGSRTEETIRRWHDLSGVQRLIYEKNDSNRHAEGAIPPIFSMMTQGIGLPQGGGNGAGTPGGGGLDVPTLVNLLRRDGESGGAEASGLDLNTFPHLRTAVTHPAPSQVDHAAASFHSDGDAPLRQLLKDLGMEGQEIESARDLGRTIHIALQLRADQLPPKYRPLLKTLEVFNAVARQNPQLFSGREDVIKMTFVRASLGMGGPNGHPQATTVSGVIERYFEARKVDDELRQKVEEAARMVQTELEGRAREERDRERESPLREARGR